MVKLFCSSKMVLRERQLRSLGVFLFITMLFFSVPVFGQESCNLGGGWIAHVPDKNFTHGGYKITQEGNKLTFIAYDGNKSNGYFTVVATDWGGGKGLLADNGNRINWDNGSYWIRESSSGNYSGGSSVFKTKLNLGGGWIAHVPDKNFTHGGYKITQEGNKLTFIAYDGNKSNGYFTVVATDWGGGKGLLADNGNRINWDNGSYWVRE